MAVKKANPMQTRTGKPRLGPLGVRQLEEALKNAKRGRDRARILTALAKRRKTEQVSKWEAKPSEAQAEAPAAE